MKKQATSLKAIPQRVLKCQLQLPTGIFCSTRPWSKKSSNLAISIFHHISWLYCLAVKWKLPADSSCNSASFIFNLRRQSRQKIFRIGENPIGFPDSPRFSPPENIQWCFGRHLYLHGFFPMALWYPIWLNQNVNNDNNSPIWNNVIWGPARFFPVAIP